jgi:hypothetical protein
MKYDLTCPGCGEGYFRNQAWQHEGCATNTVATNKSATNKPMGNAARSDPDKVGREAGVTGGERPARTLNRRDRSAYNAYQREYMRKRRG